MKHRVGGPTNGPPTTCLFPIETPITLTFPAIGYWGHPGFPPIYGPFTDPWDLDQIYPCIWQGTSSQGNATLYVRLSLYTIDYPLPAFWLMQTTEEIRGNNSYYNKPTGSTPFGIYVPSETGGYPLTIEIAE